MQPSAGTEVVQLMEERKSLRTFCSGSAVLTYPFQQGCEQCQTAWETSTPALTPAKIVQLSLQRLSSACPCAFSGQSGENENLMVIWFFVCTGQQPWQRNGPKSLLSVHTHCCSSLFPLLLVFPFRFMLGSRSTGRLCPSTCSALLSDVVSCCSVCWFGFVFNSQANCAMMDLAATPSQLSSSIPAMGGCKAKAALSPVPALCCQLLCHRHWG